MKRNCLDWLGVELPILVAMLKNRRKKKTTAKVKQELLERLTKRQQERSGDDLRRSIIHRAAHPPLPSSLVLSPFLWHHPRRRQLSSIFVDHHNIM